MYDKFQSGQNITDDVLEEAIQHREGVFEESFASSDLSSSTSRAFQTLNYLKLLSVHPALVVDEKMHPEYYRRLISDAACSGKLMALAQLLIDSGVCSDRDATRAFSDLLERSRIDSEGLAIRSSSADASIESRFEVVERNGRRMPVYRKSLTEISTSSVSTNPRTSGEENEKSRDSDDDDEFPPNSRPVKYSLQTSQSNKCVVFAQHRSVLDAIEECVMKAGFPDVVYERLDGSVPMSRRLDIIDRFSNGVTVESKQQQRTDDIRILFMTTRACGLGLNLSAADTVIFVENDWNPFVDLQAMDRTHRIGQIHPVSVYRIIGTNFDALLPLSIRLRSDVFKCCLCYNLYPIADSTIEARIMALRDRKEDVAGQVRYYGLDSFKVQICN
jgi:TATA-binding protein-associated factor